MYIMNHELTRIKNSHCERKRSNLKEERDCHGTLSLAMTIALSSALICGNLRPDICV